ncbi:MAG TPA: hypothetical protein VHV83_06985 [Armatimonadota bacterium]|nr:hypothetical protein [Armatimonadota bacterium]
MPTSNVQRRQCRGVSTTVKPDGTMVATVDHLTKETYLPICTVNAQSVQSYNYVLSFEARATGDFPGGLGLGIDDKRGWSATSSGTNAEGVETATDWTKFECTLLALNDCPGVSVCWRFRPKSGKAFTGTEEIRNLKVTAYSPIGINDHPQYPAITTSASRSADGRTLYLMVFNRHQTDAIPTTIRINGIDAIKSVRRWMVNGPSLLSTNLNGEVVREMESGVVTPITQDGVLTYTAPAHSMTAFEITQK